MTSIIQTLKNRKEEIKKSFTNLVKDISVSEEQYDNRMTKCATCHSFIKLTSQCKECGCVMTLKAKLTKSKCPLDKWDV